MPNIKSAIKRTRVANRNNDRNTAQRSSMRTSLKQAREAVAAGDYEAAKAKVSVAYQLVDKAVKRKILHKNTAARYKSKLAQKLKAIESK